MVAESARCSQIMSTRKIRRGDNTRILSIHVRREIYSLPNLPTRRCVGNGERTSGGNEMYLIVVTCLSEYRGERRVHVTGRPTPIGVFHSRASHKGSAEFHVTHPKLPTCPTRRMTHTRNLPINELAVIR